MNIVTDESIGLVFIKNVTVRLRTITDVSQQISDYHKLQKVNEAFV